MRQPNEVGTCYRFNCGPSKSYVEIGTPLSQNMIAFEDRALKR